MKTLNLLLGLAFLMWLASGCAPDLSREDRQRAQALFEHPEPPYPEITDHNGNLRRWVNSVRPLPSRTISLSSPEDWDWFEFGGTGVGDVCVDFEVLPLLREGDFWVNFTNWEVFVDGQLITKDDVFQPEQAGDEVGIIDYEENYLAAGPNHEIYCVDGAVRKIGLHVVDLKVWTSTGEESSYSWAFEVTR